MVDLEGIASLIYLSGSEVGFYVDDRFFSGTERVLLPRERLKYSYIDTNVGNHYISSEGNISVPSMLLTLVVFLNLVDQIK